VEIRELVAFTAVAEEGSVSAAARRLHLSQSAVSQTIGSLERQLGTRLLNRTSTGVTTTDAGAVLLREGRALIAQHDRVLAAVTGQAAASAGTLRIGVPLELPIALLPRALAELASTFPQTRADIWHASSTAQLRALRDGELDLALARECPSGARYDAVLSVEEALGVLLATDKAKELAGPAGVRLHKLGDLEWLGFARSEAPSWHDQVTATLRSHGIQPRDQPPGDHPLIAEVKLAAVGAGRAFALAPAGWPGSPGAGSPEPSGTGTLPGGVTWYPLIGNPLVRRTWAVWSASSRRRDLAALVAALDMAM
jgi:molybdate transport repressor ModE-like protein